MKTLSMTIMACWLFVIVGCDAKDNFNKPKTQARTMIIGGMPAFDHDYKISKDTVILAEQIQQK